MSWRESKRGDIGKGEDTDFTAQLAQFTSLQGIQNLNTNFTNMFLLQGLTQGANMIGKTITYDVGSSPAGKGKVDSVRVDNGSINLVVGSNSIALGQVRGVESK